MRLLLFSENRVAHDPFFVYCCSALLLVVKVGLAPLSCWRDPTLRYVLKDLK